MTAGSPVAPRRSPKQRRSQQIVAAILEAGSLLLREEGAEALTTNRIAERADVSIGSLYRYFPNKAAIVAAICDAETRREANGLASADWPFDRLALEDALAELVDYQLERHRRLMDMGGEFYRDRHREYSLTHHVGRDRVEQRIRAVLLRHADRVAVRDSEQAAYPRRARGLGDRARHGRRASREARGPGLPPRARGPAGALRRGRVGAQGARPGRRPPRSEPRASEGPVAGLPS